MWSGYTMPLITTHDFHTVQTVKVLDAIVFPSPRWTKRWEEWKRQYWEKLESLQELLASLPLFLLCFGMEPLTLKGPEPPKLMGTNKKATSAIIKNHWEYRLTMSLSMQRQEKNNTSLKEIFPLIPVQCPVL